MVAAFNASYSGDYFSNTNESYKPAEGIHFASTGGASTKYATAYANATTSNVPSEEMSKIGDAIWEVYSTSANYAWNIDSSKFVYATVPFFLRGGHCNSGVYAGFLSTENDRGSGGGYIGFRAVLV